MGPLQMSRVLMLLAATSVVCVACATPSASALQAVPTATAYWSFLWPTQTAWMTSTPTAQNDVLSTTSTSAPTAATTNTQSAPPSQAPTATESPLPSLPDTPLPTPTPPVTKLKAT